MKYWATALLLFAALIRFAPQDCRAAESDLDKILISATSAERGNDYKKAVELYREAATRYSNSAKSWAAYGEHLRFYTHDSDAASEAFRKAVEAPDTDAYSVAFAWRGLGELQAKGGHDDEALKLMQKSLEAMPLADTHRSICHIFVMRKDWEHAAEHARKAVELEPDDPIALLLYAAQLHRAGKVTEGQSQFEKAMRLVGSNGPELPPEDKPVHCCVLYNAAGYYAVCGRKSDALKALESFFKTPNHLHLTRAQIEDDSDFSELKAEAMFVKLLDQYLPH